MADLKYRLPAFYPLHLGESIAVEDIPLAIPSAITASFYTFVLADMGTKARFNSGSAQTATVPPNSAVAFPVGAQIELQQDGVGQLTIAAGAGVTINTSETLKLAKRHARAVLCQDALDVWNLSGYLEAA